MVHSLSGIQPIATFRQAVVEPVFKTKSMFEIARGVVNEMLKIPELWDDTDEFEFNDFKKNIVNKILNAPIQDYIKYQLSAHPGAYEQMLKEGVFYTSDKPEYGSTLKPGYRFKTRTGKIELANVKYPDKGLDALPVYQKPRQPMTRPVQIYPRTSRLEHPHRNTEQRFSLGDREGEHSLDQP